MWTQQEVAEATHAKVSGVWNASRVCIDSRQVQKGDLFVALKGERLDGHDYAQEALQKGAAAILISEEIKGLPQNTPYALVGDTMKALVDMAVYNRARCRALIIGVTGSVGKTSTKEALKVAFSAHGTVFATEGNLNNHIGLPLNLANISPDTNYGIFELGMNHAGEISYLTRLARPTIAMITTVEAVHLEFFESVEGIADAKSEILEGMPSDGTILLNRDNRYFDRCAMHANKRGVHIVSFGMHPDALFRLKEYGVKDLATVVSAATLKGDIHYSLGAIGKHWAMTSLMVLAAADAAGLDLVKTARAMSAVSEPEGRGKFMLLPVPTGEGDYTLIDDCYNASPASMSAAFAKQKELSSGLSGAHRNIAVLGDMLELGMRAPEFHAGLADDILEAGIDLVYACGPLMRNLFDALPEDRKGGYAPDAQALLPIVRGAIHAADVVLIKGSNGSKMRIIRDALKQVHTQTRKTADAL